MDFLTYVKLFGIRLFMIAIGVLLNCSLLHVIRKYTPSGLRPYSVVLAVHAVEDIVNETFNLLGSGLYVNGGKYAIYLNTSIFAPLYWPVVSKLFVLGYMYSAVYVPTVMVSLDFWFRYKTVVRSQQMPTRNVLQYALWAYFGAAIVAFVLCPIAMTMDVTTQSPELDKIVDDLRVQQLGPYREYRNISYTSFPLDDPIANLVLVIDNTAVGITFSFIIYVIWQMRKKMAEARSTNVSSQVTAVQRQINIIMACHTLAPLLVCAPLLLYAVSMLLNYDVTAIARFVAKGFEFVPIIKPLVAILVVPAYRRVLFSSVLSKVGPTTTVVSEAPKSTVSAIQPAA